MDYNSYHANIANSYIDVKDKKVLVIGCNRGKDVSYFLEFAAQEVWGIDVINEVGKDYIHEKAKYHKMSAEKIKVEDNSFDLVYCFATMEHILNIEKAFTEMVRVTKPEGMIYCIASPLWNSRQGHHKCHIFDADKYPWIHLTLTKEEIKSRCHKGEIDYPDWVEDIEDHIDHILDPQYFNVNRCYFNRCLAQDYVKVCDNLENVNIIRNDLDLEKEYHLAHLSVDDFRKLLERNINSTELLALTHTFVAKKVSSEKDKFSNQKVELDTNPDSIKEYIGESQNTKLKLQETELELQKAYKKIEAMETTKFWKLRSFWFKLKKNLGLPMD